MKTTAMTGRSIKEDNGSGYSLAQAFPGRRFHDATIYAVKYEGKFPDNSNVRSITRIRNIWMP